MTEVFVCTPRLRPTIPFFSTSAMKEEEDKKIKTTRIKPKSKTLHHYELPIVRIPKFVKRAINGPKTPQGRSKRIRPFKTPYVINPPISPKKSVLLYWPLLTEYEKNEVNDFPEIYFLGKLSSKIIPTDNSENNFGFDDCDGNYIVQIGDHLAYRYEVLEFFGEGAFGSVLKCFDHKTKTIVAVKAIVNNPELKEQALIEAKVLSILNDNKCREIITAYDFFIFRNHPFITFEVLGENLSDICDAPLQRQQIHTYARQILTALDCIHQTGIIHCDIKPDNIMFEIDSKTLIKLIDFGSSCFIGKPMFTYIQSRHYRAPEVILGLPYGPPMDIWGFGCVLAEMINGDVLFRGEDEHEQLQMIGEVLGPPPKHMISKGSRSSKFFESNFTPKTKYRRKPGSKQLEDVLETNDELLIDLIYRCLTWDPNDRISSIQALNHPWIKNRDFSVRIKSLKRPHL